MSKQIVSVSLAAMLAACASVPEVDTRASSSNKLGVVQVGTKQNAELIFCEHEKCPQRTREQLLAVKGIGPKSADAILAALS